MRPSDIFRRKTIALDKKEKHYTPRKEMQLKQIQREQKRAILDFQEMERQPEELSLILRYA